MLDHRVDVLEAIAQFLDGDPCGLDQADGLLEAPYRRTQQAVGGHQQLLAGVDHRRGEQQRLVGVELEGERHQAAVLAGMGHFALADLDLHPSQPRVDQFPGPLLQGLEQLVALLQAVLAHDEGRQVVDLGLLAEPFVEGLVALGYSCNWPFWPTGVLAWSTQKPTPRNDAGNNRSRQLIGTS